MRIVRHATEVECVRRMREMLRTNISSKSDVVDLFYCCFTHPFRSFYLILKEDIWGQDLDLEMRQKSRELLVG